MNDGMWHCIGVHRLVLFSLTTPSTTSKRFFYVFVCMLSTRTPCKQDLNAWGAELRDRCAKYCDSTWAWTSTSDNISRDATRKVDADLASNVAHPPL